MIATTTEQATVSINHVWFEIAERFNVSSRDAARLAWHQLSFGWPRGEDEWEAVQVSSDVAERLIGAARETMDRWGVPTVQHYRWCARHEYEGLGWCEGSPQDVEVDGQIYGAVTIHDEHGPRIMTDVPGAGDNDLTAAEARDLAAREDMPPAAAQALRACIAEIERG